MLQLDTRLQDGGAYGVWDRSGWSSSWIVGAMIAFHLAWTAYGSWFPNDLRGSWSEEVWKPELKQLRAPGDDWRMIDNKGLDEASLQRFLNRGRSRLQHSPIILHLDELPLVGGVIEEVLDAKRVPAFACSILRDHVHLLVGRCEAPYQKLVNVIKGRSAQRIRERRSIVPAKVRKERQPIWTQGYWVRYVDDWRQLERVISYVEGNPAKHGLPPQDWGFLKR